MTKATTKPQSLYLKAWAVSFSLAALVLLLVAAPVLAHRYYAALSDVNYNADTHNLEFVHRFIAHDVEEALSREAGERLSFDENPDAMLPLLKDYVTSRMVVAVDGAPIERQWVGVELDGEILWVYEEHPLAAPPASLQVENTLLLDLFAAQVNTLNLTVGDFHQSLTFLRGTYTGELHITD